MVFNAMITNNDDHPRNHALLRTPDGWRLSPAYDIVPMPMETQEPRNLALDVGEFGRAGACYNLISRCEVFGLTPAQARHEIDTILKVVQDWRQFYADRGVTSSDREYLEKAILPAAFFRDGPPDPI